MATSKPVPTSDFIGSHKTGSLQRINVEKISEILGFGPNATDIDDAKVTVQWDFRVNGKDFSIWDYKGSKAHNYFSTYGDKTVLKELFKDHYQGE
jgi:hypothetical protein